MWLILEIRSNGGAGSREISRNKDSDFNRNRDGEYGRGRDGEHSRSRESEHNRRRDGENAVRKVVLDRLHQHVNSGHMPSTGVNLLAGKLTNEFVKSRTIITEYGMLRTDLQEQLVDYVDSRVRQY